MQANRNSIPRLCLYKTALYRFRELGFSRIYSEHLAEAAGSTSALVRKDFSLFGIPGNKRGGYQIDLLLDRINGVLGKNQIHKVVLVGAGNLGSALIKYKNFIKEGICIEAAFDLDLSKKNKNSKIPVFPLSELSGYITENRIEIAIITVPESAAEQVFGILVAAGIKGVLNFAPIQLKAPKGCVVHSVNLAVVLENLIYFSKHTGETVDSQHVGI
jgi:redox-sensing transcriptional repressor